MRIRPIPPVPATSSAPAPREAPLVSAIVSTYNAERFIRGCLEDLEAQTIAGRLEIVVVDSGSQQGEGAIVKEFQQRYPNIVYLRTEQREGVYAAWNRGIRAARGIYVTNANTDDRHRRDALEILSRALEQDPAKALAYGDVYITDVPNQTFDTRTVIGEHAWLDFSRINVLRRCEIGPQPMWRRGLHDEIGWFNESLAVAGDYEFWLRIAEKHDGVHIPEKLGLYLSHAESVEHASAERTYYETQRVREKYIRRFLADGRITKEEGARILTRHKEALSAILARCKASPESTPIQEVELHFAAMILMMYRQRNFTAARQLCDHFFTVFGESSRIVTLYRMLLLEPTIPQAPPPGAPMVSIVIPLYNQGRYLDEAVASVVNQSYTRWECVVIDDGSTDDSYQRALEVQKRYAGLPITVLRQENRGKGPTRNRGVRETSGAYVCVLDADDMLASTYLETAVRMLGADPDTGWVTPKTLQFGRNNQVFYGFTYDFVLSLLLCLSPVTAIFRRSLWEDLGGYREDMTDREDWEFWVRAGELGWRSATTPGAEFLYRIQFQRFGERPDVNFRSKEEMVRLHPWWYRDLDEKERREAFFRSVGCALPESVLRPEAVARIRACQGGREGFRRVVDEMKRAFTADGKPLISTNLH